MNQMILLSQWGNDMFKLFKHKTEDIRSMKDTWSIQFTGTEAENIASMKFLYKCLDEDGSLLKYQTLKSMKMVKQRTKEMANEYYLLIEITSTTQIEVTSFKLKLDNILNNKVETTTAITHYPGNLKFTERRVLDMVDYVE